MNVLTRSCDCARDTDSHHNGCYVAAHIRAPPDDSGSIHHHIDYRHIASQSDPCIADRTPAGDDRYADNRLADDQTPDPMHECAGNPGTDALHVGGNFDGQHGFRRHRLAGQPYADSLTDTHPIDTADPSCTFL